MILGTNSDSPPEGKQVTRLRPDGIMETLISGYVTVALVQEHHREYAQLGGARVWLFLIENVSGYDPRCTAESAKGHRIARQKFGLQTVIAVVAKPMIRMGVRVVAMLTTLDIRVAATREEAEKVISKLR